MALHDKEQKLIVEDPRPRSPFKPRNASRREARGKSADARYVTMSTYIRRDIHSQFKKLLQFQELEMSAVVEQLLEDFIAAEREKNQAVKVWLQSVDG